LAPALNSIWAAALFFASTANSVIFGNGFTFSATNPQAPPLLTVNIPVGLQYDSNPGAIQAQAAVLRVPDGQTLTLAGGAVTVNGGQLLAPGGRVELAGVAATGAVGLAQQGQEWRLNVPDGLARADVAIANDANLNVRLGGGGSIAITARNVAISGAGTRIRAGIVPSSGTAGAQAGDIDIDATDTVNLDAIFISNAVVPGGIGNAGGIRITTGKLSVINGTRLSATTFGQGDAGDITIMARDSVAFDGVSNTGIPSFAGSEVAAEGIGQGGDIRITTGKLSVTNGAQLSTTTRGKGNAGNIDITARDTVTFDGVGSHGFNFNSAAGSEVAAEGIGQGGDIRITTGSLSLTNGGVISTTTNGQGDAGNVTITAKDSIFFDGMGGNGSSVGVISGVDFKGIGEGGDIRITTGNLFLSNGAQLLSSTRGQGGAGTITITASDVVSFDGVGSNGSPSIATSSVSTGGIGEGGDISITADKISLTNGGGVNASTSGRGNAGNISFTAKDAVSIDGNGSLTFVQSVVASGGIGRGGDISITTNRLSLIDGGSVNASTSGRGDGGNVNITASDMVFVDGSVVGSQVDVGVIGKGGNVSLTTGRLTVIDGGLIATNTFGRGDAGNITITASDRVSFDGVGSDGFSNGLSSNTSSQVERGAIGKGGDIRITTGSLSLTSGGLITASTLGRGNAGKISITASDAVSFDGVGSNGFVSGAYSTVDSGGIGQGGDIRITTDSLALTNGGVINAATFGQGDAGNITITASDRVSFDGVGSSGFGSGAYSTVRPGAIGQGGNITVETELFSITNEATLSASSDGSGRAGNLDVNVRQLRLDNQGSIQAQTALGQGGNITLQVQDYVLLRRGSTISATAGTAQAGGDGGNISFTGGFIVAISNENSDITANAFTGRGGRVEINAQGLFGIQFRPQLTPLSDITASSTFGLAGVVAITTPDIDPNRGLIPLPIDLGDASRLIVQTCPTDHGIAKPPNQFIITGRGGLPPTPREAMDRDATQVDLVTAADEPISRPASSPSHPPTLPPSHSPITEAHQIQIAADGRVFLVAGKVASPMEQFRDRLLHCR
jgi:large exoprotein involved in heme utilization and adhesion